MKRAKQLPKASRLALEQKRLRSMLDNYKFCGADSDKGTIERPSADDIVRSLEKILALTK